jgi:hypothetical protein
MLISKIQSLAITARMAAIVGSDTFDRLFAGVEFNEIDGDILRYRNGIAAVPCRASAVFLKSGNRYICR